MKTITTIFLFVLLANSSLFAQEKLNTEDKAFFVQIQKIVLAEDAESLSQVMSYPLEIRHNGETFKLQNETDVKKYAALIFTPKLKSAVRTQTADSLFKNWRGVMIGQGVIWFSEVAEKATTGERYVRRVIAINTGKGKSPASATGSQESEIQPGPPSESPSRSPAAEENVTEYVVAKGDSANAICRKFRISIEELLASNPGLKVQRLQVGQRVLIPKRTSSTKPAETLKSK